MKMRNLFAFVSLYGFCFLLFVFVEVVWAQPLNEISGENSLMTDRSEQSRAEDGNSINDNEQFNYFRDKNPYDFSLFNTAVLIENYYRRPLEFVNFYHGVGDGRKGGTHLIVKLKGQSKFFVLSWFGSVDGYILNDVRDTVKLQSRTEPKYFYSEGWELSRTISYILDGSARQDLIIDAADRTKTYRGADSDGVSLKVRIPKNQCFIYTVSYDSYGMPRERRFDADINSFINRPWNDKAYDTVVDTFQDTIVDRLVTSEAVRTFGLAVLLSQPEITAATTIFLGKGLVNSAAHVGGYSAHYMRKLLEVSGVWDGFKGALSYGWSTTSALLDGLQSHSHDYLFKIFCGAGK